MPDSTFEWAASAAQGAARPVWQLATRDLNRKSTGVLVTFDACRILPRGTVDGPNKKLVPSHRLDGTLRPTVAPDGTLHPRFTALKQWIVNLDYARAKQRADRGADAPAWDTLRQGLDTLLAPFKFAGVDDRFDVLFETPTGTVSIDEFSDGLRSLFVIVAELMMRLSLCTDDPARVLEQEACCLIDEIDAHLHPRWQQTVLPGPTQLFPNVQFIVTTHSPLVVAPVWPHQVFRLDPEWT